MIATGTMTRLTAAPLESGPRISEENLGMDRVEPMLGFDTMAALTDGLADIRAAGLYLLGFGLGRIRIEKRHAEQRQDPNGVHELGVGLAEPGSRWLRKFHGGFPDDDESNRSAQ